MPSSSSAVAPDNALLDSRAKELLACEQHAAFATSKRLLVGRGCTEEEATRALSLLIGMGVPPAQLQRWVNDLWSLVEAALDGVENE